MTGVKIPAGIAGASVAVSSKVAVGTLPFTGIALGSYVALSGGLILTGVVLRVFAKTERP